MKNNNNSLSQITEVELVYHNKVSAEDRPTVQNSTEAYQLLLPSWDRNKIELVESFKIMLLDRRNACLGISEVARGGVHDCFVDPKIIFATALKSDDPYIIVV